MGPPGFVPVSDLLGGPIFKALELNKETAVFLAQKVGIGILFSKYMQEWCKPRLFMIRLVSCGLRDCPHN